MTCLARSKYAPERRVRSRRIARWRSVRAATRAGSICVAACSVALMGREPTTARGGRVRELTRLSERGPADLSAGRLGQRARVVDPARVLVRRGLLLHVVLELAGEGVRRSVAVAQH